ncbi:hypothetical protein AX17_003273 [Amanita inopinata Kibby_2008]|nr:hypothetical protein AX17_003273 [Amanita inopinata Kibby_2008]
MRSSPANALFRRSRSLNLSFLHPQRPHSYPRPLPARLTLPVSTVRPASSSTPSLRSSATDPPAPDVPEPLDEATEPSTEDPEKPRARRTRTSSGLSKDSEPLELPDELNIFWSPEQDSIGDPTHISALPPPELFQDALNNLQIILHPQTQHRATYPSPLGPPVEPTFGLFCPIEGGDYVVDATVRELALRTGAEVLVLDAVQLAAGEWGHFGKAASALQLPRNPLHFSSSYPPPPPNAHPFALDEEADLDSGPHLTPQSQQMMLTLMTPPSIQGRTIMASSSRRPSPPSRVKVFFDTLVNLSPKQDVSEVSSSRTRPRLIYVRDFPTLAPSSSSWYPHLLSAVRQRRRGPISRPSSPIGNPMAIIFGMTPAIAPPIATYLGSGNGPLNTALSRNSPSHTTGLQKQTRSDWGEDEAGVKAREKRLRDRLRKWEKGDIALSDEYAKLAISQDPENGSEPRPEIIIIGPGNGIPGPHPFFNGLLPGQSGKGTDSDSKGFFFRTSSLVPQTRSLDLEQSTRINRRREINELTMRMGVGAIGGCLQKESVDDILGQELPANTDGGSSGQDGNMRLTWGNSIEVWANVRKIADRALGAVLSSTATLDQLDKGSLEPTPVPWTAIHDAWLAHQTTSDLRKVWLKESSCHAKFFKDHEEDEEGEADRVQAEIDEVVEQVKNNSDLDTHEQRLLPCIVDPASITTSFSQVYLPAHTIDSVRTIVSLPLLHPQAFRQGILKEHGMTGCLLFGPPGTGKTLVIRALAKEAGCRMMMISPSDVMDMYVGEGEKLVKAVFSLARRLAPCVIFLDEIDALFGARMSARESGGAFAHRGVITEFMQEMDGLKSSREDSVIVIGATNRPFDLDDAVLRRLPRRLLVDLPDEKEREEILKILLRDEQLADDVDIKNLARGTESFSGSDLKHLCVSAALDAVKEHVQLPWAMPQTVTQASKVVATGVIPEATTDGPDPVFTTSASAEPVFMDHRSTDGADEANPVFRVLRMHNFLKALKEIVPSSSEVLGSLAELRKWNEEFGEGRKDKKRQQVWGKGRFGFTDKVDNGEGNGRVAHS